ncbi:MAG: signal peptidase I [Deltaproteobacteria bacterium]|nr:signal peptidase I [Deltaproteobacteria bacterium]
MKAAEQVQRWAVVVACLAAVVAIRTWVGRPMLVRGHSMKPTLFDGDLVWLDALHRNVELGDIAAYTARNGEQRVKRVVAIGGERIGVQEGQLVRAGAVVPIERLGMAENWKDAAQVLPLAKLNAERFRETVGREHEAQRFHPSTSAPDQAVPSDAIFLVGDNRDDSIDDRADGPTPRSKIEGRVRWVLISMTRRRFFLEAP